MSELNYHAVNGETGEECGHKHHSPQSAKKCAKTHGWKKFFIETYNGGRVVEEGFHAGSKKNKMYDGYTKKIGKIIAHQINNEEVEITLGKEE